MVQVSDPFTSAWNTCSAALDLCMKSYPKHCVCHKMPPDHHDALLASSRSLPGHAHRPSVFATSHTSKDPSGTGVQRVYWGAETTTE